MLISLHPRFAETIFGSSTAIVLRRTRICAPEGSQLILYATAPTKAVVGVATVQLRDTDRAEAIWCRYEHNMALRRDEFDAYLAGSRQATALVLTAPDDSAAPARLPLSETERHSARRQAVDTSHLPTPPPSTNSFPPADRQ